MVSDLSDIDVKFCRGIHVHLELLDARQTTDLLRLGDLIRRHTADSPETDCGARSGSVAPFVFGRLAAQPRQAEAWQMARGSSPHRRSPGDPRAPSPDRFQSR